MERRSRTSLTVGKALRILELLEEGDLRLIDLAARLDEHKSNVQRLLATLQAHGFVRQDEQTRRYSLGLRMLQLASATLARMDLRDAAREMMQYLGDLTNETVHLGVYDEPHIVYIDKMESTYPIRMYSRVGARAECYCTGLGKAILAALDGHALGKYLEAVSFTKFTPRTVTSAEELHEELAKIRFQGYAVDEQEHEEGVRCVAAPIFGFDGLVVGAISVTVPAFRKSEKDLLELAPNMLEAARRISMNLGSSMQRRNRETNVGKEQE